MEEKSLRFSVFGIDEDERNVSTGVVELKLSVLDLPLQPFSGWLYLQDQNKVSTALAYRFTRGENTLSCFLGETPLSCPLTWTPPALGEQFLCAKPHSRETTHCMRQQTHPIDTTVYNLFYFIYLFTYCFLCSRVHRRAHTQRECVRKSEGHLSSTSWFSSLPCGLWVSNSGRWG